MATEFKVDAVKIGMAIIVVVGAFLATQVWGRVTDLETRVVELNVAVAQLADLDARVDAMNLKVSQTEADLATISESRDTILRELCMVLERPPEACGVSP